MRKLLSQLKRGNRGYTLIEILVVVAILGVLAVVAVPNVIALSDDGEAEAKQAEAHNLQLVVQVMMTEAGEEELDDSYDGVQTLSEIEAVTAGGGACSLDSYLHLLGGENQLLQAYDISQDGVVTVDEGDDGGGGGGGGGLPSPKDKIPKQKDKKKPKFN
jgi:type IV pilus assembly protein PilA